MDKGCKWEGTIGTLEKHAATCKPACYVFVNDFNILIEGQKIHEKKLKDADRDSRFRFDVGKLLDLLADGRKILDAFLYSSVPPHNDTLWKAAWENNCKLQTFKRSESGKERELNGAMSRDIMKCFHTCDRKEDVVFIIMTGDPEIKPHLEEVLKNRVPVEIWSWEQATAQEFRFLAKEQGALLRIKYLDKTDHEKPDYRKILLDRGRENYPEFTLLGGQRAQYQFISIEI